MNTKTMRLPPRRVLTPSKRKERDDDDLDAPAPAAAPAARTPKTSSFTKLPQPITSQAAKLDSSNQLLAGYLAHEYLTKGTLFGQLFDPAQAQIEPVPVQDAESRKSNPVKEEEAEPQGEKYQRYVEVASLLNTDGAHIPGIVNPTQLARSLQM